ncbi:MAG: hypothetical protein AAF847_07245 [Bacteroidota bacterium]
MQHFEERLKGGHSNSLSNTVEIVSAVLAEPSYFDELFGCYFSDDAVVCLRVSNAMKRIGKANKKLLIPYLDRFLNEIATIDQASTQWTLAQLFLLLERDMSASQLAQASAIVQHNLSQSQDWIVLNTSMETLTKWVKQDKDLKAWLLPHLERLTKDTRKSVQNRASKSLKALKK